MGACLSCLSLRKDADDADRQPLLYDDPYANHPNPNGNYGSWNQSTTPPPQNIMSPEEVRREQQALNNITRWASDQIVEIFPHRNNLSNLAASGMSMGVTQSQSNGNGYSDTLHGHGNENGGLTASAHQDILLSMIPGDKSKRSIRIYPASRPGSSKDADSLRSKGSLRGMNGKGTDRTERKGVFVKLNVDMP